ncbi:MAG: DeoR/GlpR transcriptional regulator [Erysipelotrichaceae bacterium]|nr:DeoR/GlpR transcriptional regulator [Erysipelotrichaceae bacterium]
MVLNERQQQIFEWIQKDGKVSVKRLSQVLYVSEMTIRRDLGEMEKKGLLKRYHGGAVSKIEGKELPISKRMYVDEAEKRVLAKKAERYLSNHINVFVDSSSTVTYIIPYMRKYEGITLITNSVKSLLCASQYHIPCILLGGEYHEHDMCLIGTMAKQEAMCLNVDVAFFSTQSYSDDGIISDADARQSEVRMAIMAHAKQSVFLFETINLHRQSLYTLFKADDATAIILPVDE